MAILTNKLDAAHQILGVNISSLALFTGSILMGALLIGFLSAGGILLFIWQLKRSIAKRPPFTLSKFIYKQLPTRSKISGKQFNAMIESFKSEWVK